MESVKNNLQIVGFRTENDKLIAVTVNHDNGQFEAQEVEKVDEDTFFKKIFKLAKFDHFWSQMQTLMLGIFLFHLVQPLAVLNGLLDWKDKFYVSIAGAVIYGICFILLLLKKKLALWISIIGPCLGLIAVLTGFILSKTGIIQATISPDVFQAAGGILQIWALILAIILLRRDK